MENKITVFIADDHPVFLKGLRMIIESKENLVIVGEASNGTQAFSMIQLLKPEVAVLDLNMPDKNGFEIVRDLSGKGIDTNIIFLTMHDEEATFNSALDLGVKGFILKDSAATDVVSAIETIAAGNNFITPKLSTYLLNRRRFTRSLTPKLDILTVAEMKILRRIAEHKTTKEIAAELFVSPRTIDRHRYNICNKLEISGINSLLKFAIENKSKFE